MSYDGAADPNDFIFLGPVRELFMIMVSRLSTIYLKNPENQSNLL